MRICVIGPWQGGGTAAGEGAANKALAETLREMGHTVTPSSNLEGLAAKAPHPIFEKVLDIYAKPRLASALFQYDAVILSGGDLAHGRVLRALDDRPAILWEHGEDALPMEGLDIAAFPNVTFVSGSQERQQAIQEREPGRQAVMVDANEDKEAFKTQLAGLLDSLAPTDREIGGKRQ